MRKEKKEISKELIIETTLRLIDENRGIKDVNLRGIAKEIGCAHTNLYNYFSSLDEIFWESLGQVLLNMLAYVDSNAGSKENNEEKVYFVFSSIIDFSMKHPGWFRLVWLESIGGKPPPEVMPKLQKPGQFLKLAVTQSTVNELTDEQALFIGDILHTYIHGELCKWINNRGFRGDAEQTKKKLLSNLKQLFKLLVIQATNEERGRHV